MPEPLDFRSLAPTLFKLIFVFGDSALYRGTKIWRMRVLGTSVWATLGLGTRGLGKEVLGTMALGTSVS